MFVITLRAVPERLRGYLSRYMLEVDAGVYVGQGTKRLRERLWKKAKVESKQGQATLIYIEGDSFIIETSGEKRRRPIKRCGKQLIRFAVEENS